MIVRLAMPADEDWMLDTVRMQVEETLPHMTFDPEVTRDTFRASVATAHPTIFVAENAAGPAGYAMCLLEGYAFTRGVFVVLEALYVRPENRGTRAAAALVKEFDRWGDIVGAREKILGVANGQDTDRKAAFFGRLGFQPVGGYFKKVA